MRTVRPTKIPGFDGKLPAGVDKALAERIEALTEAVDTRLGRRGDPQDRAITLRELIAAGLAKELSASPWDPNELTARNIGFRPPTDLATPPAPTGVTASGGYSVVQVYWDFPMYRNHGQTEIWRHSADTIGDAVLVGVSAGRSFIDPVGGGVTRYYWLRHVNTSGVPGPYHASAGTAATTATDVATLLTTLTGAITTSQLATALLDRVNTIATLETQVADIISAPAYDAGTTYTVNQLVTYSGNLYRAKSTTTGNLPTNTTYWESLGAYSSLAAATAGAVAGIVELNNVSAGSSSANATALYALQSTVNHASTGLAATRATLISDYSTTSDMNSAISSATFGLASTAYVTTALGSYTNTATLTATYYTIASAASLEAQYMIKLNVNGRVSGFGLHSTSTASAFVILADRFSIVSQSDNSMVAVPFVVQATSTTLNGESVAAGVYIDSAFIKNGSIESVKIGDATIDNAKISDLSADKINAGTLSTSRLNIDGATLISDAGVLKLGSVQVGNLVANSITTAKLVGQAVNAVTVSTTGSNALPTDASYEDLDSITYVKESSSSEGFLIMEFQITASCTGSGNYALYVYLKRNGTRVSGLFPFYRTKSFTEVASGKVVLTAYGAGSATYELEAQANVSGSGVSTCTVDSAILMLTEAKR